VIGATGIWWRPFLSAVPGGAHFGGRQWHKVEYQRPQDFAGRRVIVVGGGNSGAQIAADLADHTERTWGTQRPPATPPTTSMAAPSSTRPPPAAAPAMDASGPTRRGEAESGGCRQVPSREAAGSGAGPSGEGLQGVPAGALGVVHRARWCGDPVADQAGRAHAELRNFSTSR
jgi:cation diffusion facilitator CzcD-associated flavoprotein CzcO